MTFQYFFFSTYIGDFLQVIPIALLAVFIYALIYRRKHGHAQKNIGALLFVCYLAGLFALTATPNHFWDIIWHYLIYRSPSGLYINIDYRFLRFSFDFVPTFINYFSMENLGNIFLYLPFGVLYPLFCKTASWKRTVFFGFLLSLLIEIFQPLIGRSFDINDVILNTFGAFLSASIFFICRKCFKKSQNNL